MTSPVSRFTRHIVGDVADDLHFASGVVPAALKTSRASAATTIAPVAFGPELVKTQTLSNAAYWNSSSPAFGNWYSVTTSGDTVTLGLGSGGASYRVACKPGDVYQVSALCTPGTASHAGLHVLFTTVAVIPSNNYASVNYEESLGKAPKGAPRTITATFCVPASSTFFDLVLRVEGTTGQTAQFSSISIKRMLPGVAGRDKIGLLTVGWDQPRLEFRDGRCRGLISEPSRTNLVPHSNDPLMLGPSGDIAVTALSGGEPLLRAKVVAKANGYNYIRIGSPTSNDLIYGTVGTTYTVSIIVRSLTGSGTLRFEQEGFGSPGVDFENSVPVPRETSTVVTRLQGNIYRVACQFTMAASATHFGVWYFGGYGPVASAHEFEIGHIQMEAGDRATMPIVTNANSLTRQADSHTWDPKDKLDDNTFVIEWERNQVTAPVSPGEIVFAGQAGSGYEIFYNTNENYPRAYSVQSSDADRRSTTQFREFDADLVCAAAIAGNGRTVVNGRRNTEADAAGQQVASMPFVVGGHNASYQFWGAVQRIRRYKRNLGVTEMIGLTQRTERSLAAGPGKVVDYDFSKAALPANVTFSRASKATVMCPNRRGPEKVTNGSGTTTVGWTGGEAVVFEVRDGAIYCQRNAAIGAYFGQPISVTKGQPIVIEYEVVNAHGAGRANVWFGDDLGNSVNGGQVTERVYGKVRTVWNPKVTGTQWLWFFGEDGNAAILIKNISAKSLILNDADDPISLAEVPDDIPRFEWDPRTRSCKGLVVEPGATNLLQWSDTLVAGGPFDGKYSHELGWTPTTGFADPMGGKDAAELSISTEGWSWYTQVNPTQPNTDYTYSAWVKLGTATNFVFAPNDGSNWASLTGREFTATDGLNTSTWVRVSHAFTTNSTGAVNMHIGRHQKPGLKQQTSGTVYIFGQQLELGKRATGYVRTRGAVATRAADDPRITNFEPHPRNGWAWTVDGAIPSSEGTPIWIGYECRSGADCAFYTPQSDWGRGGWWNGGASVYSADLTGQVKLTDYRRMAVTARSSDNLDVSMNATDPGTAALRPFPDSVTKIRLGAYPNGNQQQPQIIRRIRYFDRTLSKPELQTITKLT